MLYKKLRQGCEDYHKSGSKYDKSYARYTADKSQDRWDNPDTLDDKEIKRLVSFLSDWGCLNLRFLKGDELDNITFSLIKNMKCAAPRLNTLKRKTLLDVKFDEYTKQMIAECFGMIAGIDKYGSVPTAKALHVAINPHLFVMWDRPILSAYDLGNTGFVYAHIFLPAMQRIANKAVKEVMDQEDRLLDDAIKSLTPCGNSLAKVIDEYNYVNSR